MWVHLDKAENTVFQGAISEIGETASDRAVAIVAATFLEDHLTSLLKLTFVREEKTISELFRVSGALGAFATKIDLAYLLNLYSRDAWKELTAIKRY